MIGFPQIFEETYIRLDLAFDSLGMVLGLELDSKLDKYSTFKPAVNPHSNIIHIYS